MAALDLYFNFVKELIATKKQPQTPANDKKIEQCTNYMNGVKVILITIMTYDLQFETRQAQ